MKSVLHSTAHACLVVPLLVLDSAQGYSWMAGIKIPTPLDLGKVATGMKFGDKKLVVITGTSSGLGKATTKALLQNEGYHVIGAVRDLEKMRVVAEVEGFDKDRFTAMHLDLANFASVNKFVEELDAFRGDRAIDRLACNAAVYQPTLDYPKWTKDGHEQQLQINYLGHFLLTSKIMPMMEGSSDARIVMIGSVTGNDNTVGGGGVYPIADLKDLEGLELGCKNPIAMMDGYNFNGAKMYKDTKLALMMTSNMLHERFHRSTGIAFSSIYPGCIAESPLFREKRPWFRKYFPIFMKYVTGGFVGEPEAGQRLFQVLHDPRCTKSGVYWSWNGGPREGRGLETLEKGGQIEGSGGAGGGWDSIFENDQSDKVLNRDLMMKLWQGSNEVTSAEWPEAYQPKSPCPTLKVVGAATSFLGVLEEQARMKASREGEGAAIVANRSLPREERRKQLETMLSALDKTPTDLQQLKQDFLRTSGEAPDLPSLSVVEGEEAELALLTGPASEEQAIVPEIDDPLEVEEKGPPQMIPGHEQLGDIPVVFQPQNVKTMAKIGQPLSDVASRADVFIRYKCRKGECKTCVVNIDGKWVSACQTKIPSLAPGQEFGVRVRPVSDAHKHKEKAAFFTPASISDGFMNNAIGMLGFAAESVAADPEFDVRIGREKAIEKLTERRKGTAQASLRAKPSAAGHKGDSVKQIVPGLLAVGSFMLVLMKQAA
mmetsp:Transcript_33219/g.65482  ORF Transcript_33219/g.65482 Transcript_33219/m.65482 type:complete len:713 (+) Transcript_33219:41-2179(+)